MNEKQFIRAVEKHKCIYSRGNLGLEKELRSIAWSQLSKKFNLPVANLKHRWRNLRDRYVRECRKRQKETSCAARNARPWSLFKDMDFLHAYIGCRAYAKSNEAAQLADDIAEEIAEVEVLSPVERETQTPVDSCMEDLCDRDEETSADALHCSVNPFDDIRHGGFYQMVVDKLNQLTKDEQEDAKMFFLNYLHNMRKTLKYKQSPKP